jgi:von Willebrand factor type A domain
MFMRVVLPTALVVSLVLPVGQSQKAIIVTVLDQSGAAVKDVAPGDLSVVEDGATRDVVSVKPATDPMTIAILIDTTKPTMGKDAPTREMRAALTTFVKTVQAASPASTIGLWEFAGAGVMTQKPTVKTDDLAKKINHIFPGQQTGGVMLEALVDASKEVSKKETGPRRVIVAVSLNSPEVSTIDPRDVAIAMRKAGVNFWAVSISSNADASTSSQGNSASRELIMNNVTTASGGLRLTGVTPISLEAQVKTIADALTSQYVVTYTRPADAPSTITNIQAVSKKGMKALTGPWVQ